MADAHTHTSSSTPPRKKQRRMQKYRVEWEKANDWVEKVRENSYKAHCTVCRRVFSIAHGGVADLKQHALSDGHKKNTRDTTRRRTLDQFVVHQATPEADMVCKDKTRVSMSVLQTYQDFYLTFHDIKKKARWLILNLTSDHVL